MNETAAGLHWWRGGWRELVSWLAPVPCVGCARPPYRLCANCTSKVDVPVRLVQRGRLQVRVGPVYAGQVRAVVRELKQHGSMLIAQALAGTLRRLMAAEPYVHQAELLIVPPSRRAAWRRRGFVPTELVARAAGVRAANPFRVARRLRDQRGLSLVERAANVRGAFVLRRSWNGRLTSRTVLLLDDVLTTGATLHELVRACEAAGANVLAVWALSETPRLSKAGLLGEQQHAGGA